LPALPPLYLFCEFCPTPTRDPERRVKSPPDRQVPPPPSKDLGALGEPFFFPFCSFLFLLGTRSRCVALSVPTPSSRFFFAVQCPPTTITVLSRHERYFRPLSWPFDISFWSFLPPAPSSSQLAIVQGLGLRNQSPLGMVDLDGTLDFFLTPCQYTLFNGPRHRVTPFYGARPLRKGPPFIWTATDPYFDRY